MKKRRYEYCSETKEVIDNELDNYVDDVVERLNVQNENKLKLFKLYQLLESEIRKKDLQIATMNKALELACEQIWAMSIWENEKEDVVKDNYNFFLDKAKEVLEENNND